MIRLGSHFTGILSLFLVYFQFGIRRVQHAGPATQPTRREFCLTVTRRAQAPLPTESDVAYYMLSCYRSEDIVYCVTFNFTMAFDVQCFLILSRTSYLVHGCLQAPVSLSYVVLTIICCLKEPYAQGNQQHPR